MSRGKPTDYVPDYCSMVIEHMEKGKSLTSFAAKVGVARNTVYEWAKRYPEFSESLGIARAKCRTWWEEEGEKGLWAQTEYDEKGKPIRSRQFNASVWIFTMKARFGLYDQRKESGLSVDDDSFETEMGDLKQKYESER